MSTLYPDTRARTDWALLARRMVIGTAVTCAALLLLAMVLSYAGLRSFYLGAGLPERWASAYPFCVDLLALVAYVAWLTLGGWYPAAVVIFGVAASALAQGYHISHGGVNAQVSGWFVLGLAGASAMVCAGLAAHLFVKIIKRALPVDFIEAMRNAGQTPALPPSNQSLPPTEPDVPDWVNGELERSFADYDTRELVRSVNGHNPPEAREQAVVAVGQAVHAGISGAPRARGESQRRGPCVPDCPHHWHDGKPEIVSKSVFYRCQGTLRGRSIKDPCPECAKAREGDAVNIVPDEQVEALTDVVSSLVAQRDVAYARIKDLDAEVRRLRGLLQVQHDTFASALERGHNLLIFARDGGVNPS